MEGSPSLKHSAFGEVGAAAEPKLFAHWNKLAHPRTKATGITALYVHDPRPTKTAHEPFARREACHPPLSRTLYVIRCGPRPGNEMTISDDVFLIRFQFDLMDGAEAV